MDCKEVDSILPLFFDDEMEETVLQSFNEHVARCPECARRLEYTRKLLLIVRERCIKVGAPDKLRQRILSSLPPPGTRLKSADVSEELFAALFVDAVNKLWSGYDQIENSIKRTSEKLAKLEEVI